MGSTWDVHRCDALRWLMEQPDAGFDSADVAPVERERLAALRAGVGS